MTHEDFVEVMEDLHIFSTSERTMPFRTEELRALATKPDDPTRGCTKLLRTFFRELFPKSVDKP